VADEIAPDLFQQRTVAVGPRFQWDTRDDTYYPRHGVFLDSGIDFFSEALGSKFSYRYYKVAFNKYTSIGKSLVFAFRGMGCAAAGDHVPIYDLCLYGSANDLRGYPAGRYQDRRMFATQAEYRLNLPAKKLLWRFGLVGFGGFGWVGQKISDVAYSDLLPGGGGGLRFRLTKQNHINFRIDYAVGKVGHTLSMGLGEAF
jgi:outer membrane protein assembly factor BamA